MLSPPSRDGIEAFVRRVDGQRFKEHEIVQRKELGSRPPTTYGYLESEDNAEFEVGVTFHDTSKLQHYDNDWRIEFSVDGRRIANHLYDRRTTDCVVKTMDFAECGEVMRGNLRFTILRTTDIDEEVTLGKQDLMVIGDIQIDLYRGIKSERLCQCKTAHKGKERDLKSLPQVDLGVAHEEDKKWSGAIGVGHTELKSPSRGGRRYKWSGFDNDKPYHRFLFKYRTTPILQLIRVIGTHAPLHQSSKRKQKQDIIYIGDSDSEEDNEMLVTPTKRQRSSQGEDNKPMLETLRINGQSRWGMDQDHHVEPDHGSRMDSKPYIGLGRYVKPKHGIGRDVTSGIARSGAMPDVRPVLTAVGQLSLGGRKRGKTPVLFKFNP